MFHNLSYSEHTESLSKGNVQRKLTGVESTVIKMYQFGKDIRTYADIFVLIERQCALFHSTGRPLQKYDAGAIAV